jgi:hypothetical protein
MTVGTPVRLYVNSGHEERATAAIHEPPREEKLPNLD